MKKHRRIFALGIVLCLAGAAFIFDVAILDEITTNVATVLRITGIGIMATQKRAMNNGGE